MKQTLATSLAFLTTSAGLFAGGINIVHLGPRDPLKFQVSADGATQDITLAHGADTGSFILPDKPSSVEAFLDEDSSIDIPASEDPRIAVLAPDGKGFKWHLLPAKPTPDVWAFRIINLSSVPAEVTSGKEVLEIPAGGETAVEVTGKPQINVSIPDTFSLKYGGSEPCSVAALLYREDEEWKAILLPDR